MISQTDYGFFDRLLHRLAFASWPIQAALADIEQVVFRTQLAPVALDRPVFISGLPRAGTTLVLELIEGADEFASYRYRDMPFLLTPMLWSALTSSADRSVKARERAHGDGVTIDIESPEAFEEVVWRMLYPKKYGAAAIEPWRGMVDEDKQRFIEAQMRKIVAVRSKGAPARRRYLSKSNGNIARLATIAGMFPDAIIVSPYRRPLDHARSLLRQHQNFLAMHEQDRFTREYMGGIGHYDFGANLKPINFAGWLAQAPPPDFASLNGWIRYWCAAYGFLLDQPNVPIHFLSYDALCTDPEPELERLEAVLGVRNPGALLKQAGDVRQPTRNHPIADGVDAGLLRQAEEVFECLEGRPLGRPAREVDPERPSLLGASHPSKNPTGSALGRG